MICTNQAIKYTTPKQLEIKRLARIIDANYNFFEVVRAKDPAQVKADIALFGNAFLDEKGNSVNPLMVKSKK